MKLAIHGGKPHNSKQFVWKHYLDSRETERVMQVMQNGVLSDFYGSAGSRFLGGKQVQELDQRWAERFEVRHAVSMNSATSALFAAVGAAGIGPGDEVIVTSVSMSATAACILGYNAIPVFVDVEPDYFCADVKDIEAKISSRTKAIVVTDLFGQPADFENIIQIARKHNLIVIEDNAQAPGALLNGQHAGTLGDIGIFSLNCHKAIQSGEGGMAVSNDDELARRLQLIRNHAEAVVGDMRYGNLLNMLGWNYRLTELQAAIAIEQLQKLSEINKRKQELAAKLDEVLCKFDFLQVPKIRPGATHVYYLYVIRFEAGKLGVLRDTFVKALNAEGYNASFGYVKPLYLLPMFQSKTVYAKGCPFTCPFYGESIEYTQGMCPNAERMHFQEVFYPNLIRYDITEKDIVTFGEAVEKVANRVEDLQ